MITILHSKGPMRSIAVNAKGNPVLGSGYYTGRQKPHYPVPAIPLNTEYVFNEPPQLIDGIFIRNHEQWMVECWYRDCTLI